MCANICSQEGRSSIGNQAPHKKIVEKKNAKNTLKWSISKIFAVKPKAKQLKKRHPISKGKTASGVKNEVAEPKRITSGIIKKQSIKPLVIAQMISPKASDSALTGVAKIAS